MSEKENTPSADELAERFLCLIEEFISGANRHTDSERADWFENAKEDLLALIARVVYDVSR